MLPIAAHIVRRATEERLAGADHTAPTREERRAGLSAPGGDSPVVRRRRRSTRLRERSVSACP
jgi:hypothetical protein